MDRISPGSAPKSIVSELRPVQITDLSAARIDIRALTGTNQSKALEIGESSFAGRVSVLLLSL